MKERRARRQCRTRRRLPGAGHAGTTASLNPETISFAASSPSRLPGGLPVIDYGAGGLVACSRPFGTPVVAWLNSLPVRDEPSSWGGVKALYR